MLGFPKTNLAIGKRLHKSPNHSNADNKSPHPFRQRLPSGGKHIRKRLPIIPRANTKDIMGTTRIFRIIE
jgi:hypothetical protein